MYTQTIDYFADMARKKRDLARSAPGAFLVGAMMAGAYIGLADILIFSVGATVDPAYRSLIMGVSFGVALTLVVIAGADLFTGYTMYMTLGWLKRRTGGRDFGALLTASWVGNFAGALVVSVLFALGGGGSLFHDGAALLHSVAEHKIHSPALELIARGILCNWLVCLAIWMAARVKSEAAKCIVIFWALFAFVASGYEHSIANMTVFAIALLGEHPETITMAGAAHNLLWVTIGNAIAGIFFMGVAYWRASPEARRADALQMEPAE